MPQLPSGRHIAITASPLANILDDTNNPGNVHIVMGIATPHDLEPYIDVLFLLPEAEAAENAIHSGYIENSLPRPPEFVPVNSGYRLSELSGLTKDWDDADKAALQEFLCGRATTTFDSCMTEVLRAQLAMRNSPNVSIRLLATWWVAGCHPAQEEGWDVGPPEWDSYDMLAALGQLADGFCSHPEKIAHLGLANERLQSIWKIIRSEYLLPPDWPPADSDVRACAEEARQAGWLDDLLAEKQQWLYQQCVIECVNLWNAYGEHFMRDFPRQYGIIELVTLSPVARSELE